MCWKRLVLHNGNDFFWQKLYLPSTALSLVFLLQLFIKETPAVLVLSLAVTYTCSLCYFQSLYERMSVPFLSLGYSHRLKQQQSSQPQFICHCWRATSPTDLCKTSHFTVLTTGLEVQACCPQQAGQGSCANGIYFHLICEHHWRHLQEQPVMQKEKWGS